MSEMEATVSFRSGNGSVNHNLRLTKEGEPRGIHDRRRRTWNETIFYEPLDDVLHRIADDALMKYNVHQIEINHKERVKTFDEWRKKIEYTRNGKQKSVYTEYIVQIGDKFSACPFEYKKDKAGNPIDKNGKIIPKWKTSAKLVPVLDEKGRMIKNKEYKRLCSCLRKIAEKFLDEHPNFQPVVITTHCDEQGSIHMHIGGIWTSRSKTGIGIGFGKTNGIQQEYEARGIKCRNTRRNNAQKMFCIETRDKLITETAKEFGIKRIDGHAAGRKYQPTKQYTASQIQYCEELEEKEKRLNKLEAKLHQQETELEERRLEFNSEKREIDNQYDAIIDAEIAKEKRWIMRERDILKEMFPDIYEKVKQENIQRVSEERKLKNAQKTYKKTIQKTIDMV